MKNEKEKDILQYVEKRINNHIKKSGENKIVINYNSIEKIVGYRFPDEVIVKIIKDNYHPLGYNYDDYSNNGGFLYLPEIKEKSCNLI